MLGSLGLVQKLALALAGVVMVGAVAVPHMTGPRADTPAATDGPAPQSPPSGVTPNTFIPGGPNLPSVPFPIPGPADADPDGDAGDPPSAGEPGSAEGREYDDLSPAVFRLGFSFFLGFAIAYALRAFVKVSLVAIGLFALLLFGMQYAGLVEVRWAAIGDRYDSAAAWFEGQFASFRAFVLGYLPSAAAALGGAALAFKPK